MRRFIFIPFLILCFSLVTMAPLRANAAIDPRAKALASMALYGTIGGTLLGIAVQAFDVEDSFGRSMAKGASLGLYAGLLFGSYVVISHYYRSKALLDPPIEEGEDYYPEEESSPYEGARLQSGYDQRWRFHWDTEDLKVNDRALRSIQRGGRGGASPIYSINILRIRF